MIHEAIDIIREKWGSELAKIPLETISDFDLPEGTKKYVVEIGLPRTASTGADLQVKFYTPNGFMNISVDERRFVVLGEDGFNYVAIQCSDESVWFIDKARPSLLEYANAHIVYLLAFIAIYAKEVVATAHARDGLVDDHEAFEQANEKLGKMLRKKLTKLDVTAFRGDESIWSVAIEELEAGVV